MKCLVAGTIAVVVLAVPRASQAQVGAGPPPAPRFFMHVNLGGAEQALADETALSSRFVRFGEVASSRATYPKPSRGRMSPLLDLGAGIMLTPDLGIGVGYSRTVDEDIVGLEATIPHPLFLNAEASASGVTGRTLKRREAAVHLTAVLSVFRTDRLEVRISGGPSLMSYSADMVSEASYAQAFDTVTPRNTIAIVGHTSETAEDRTLGINAGADVTYFLTRGLGVGAGLRFSLGTVTLSEEPLSRETQEIRVGGVLGFFGMRVRFGG
jgi:hypothetical protein